MADKRIAELNALTSTANTDLTLISDTSASETKKDNSRKFISNDSNLCGISSYSCHILQVVR